MTRRWPTPYLAVVLAGLFGLLISPIEGSASSGVERSVVDVVITADKDVAGRDGWVRFSDDSKQWVNGECRAELLDGGVAKSVVDWTTIAALSDGPQLGCAELLDDDSSGVERSVVDVVITADKDVAGRDGWVRFSDDSKQWVNGECRAELLDGGVAKSVVDWSTIAALSDGPQLGCAELLDDDSSGVERSVVDVVITADKDVAGRDGWVRFSDDSKQWVNGECRAELLDGGVAKSVVDWSTIAALSDGPQLGCAELLDDDSSGGSDDSTNTSPISPIGSGVNLDSGEYACVGGWGIFEHEGWISDLDLARQIADLGAQTVRLPLNEHCWLGGPRFSYLNAATSGENYRNRVLALVDVLTTQGLTVVLDLHWSAPSGLQATGQQKMPDLDYAPEFWRSIATSLKDNQNVAFDLFNEPHGVDWECWRDGCVIETGWSAIGLQDLVNEVRSTGATQPIILNGLDYGGDLTGWLEHRPDDPADNLIAGFHAYNQIRDVQADRVYLKACVDAACWDRDLGGILSAGYPVVIGELGQDVGFDEPAIETGGEVCRTNFVQEVIDWSEANGVSYIAWTYNPHSCGTPALLNAHEDPSQGWEGSNLNPVGELLRDRWSS